MAKGKGNGERQGSKLFEHWLWAFFRWSGRRRAEFSIFAQTRYLRLAAPPLCAGMR
jgi:hypothetical protein